MLPRRQIQEKQYYHQLYWRKSFTPPNNFPLHHFCTQIYYRRYYRSICYALTSRHCWCNHTNLIITFMVMGPFSIWKRWLYWNTWMWKNASAVNCSIWRSPASVRLNLYRGTLPYFSVGISLVQGAGRAGLRTVCGRGGRRQEHKEGTADRHELMPWQNEITVGKAPMSAHF